MEPKGFHYTLIKGDHHEDKEKDCVCGRVKDRLVNDGARMY